MSHMQHLNKVAEEDVQCLEEKEKTYQGSWKKRGGVGAFMMLARKWDRLEVICQLANYDIFWAIARDTSGKDGSLLAEVRDLRRYLLLIEAEIEARKFAHDDGTPKEDSNRHATDASLYTRIEMENAGIPSDDRGKYHGLIRPRD